MTSDQASLWIPPDLPGVEVFQAHFVRHRFGRHTHESYVLAAMEEGGEAFEQRGARHNAPVGTLVLLEPDVAHTGEAMCAQPWAYRALYVGREWFRHPPRFPNPVIADPALFARIRAFHQALARNPEPLWAETELAAILGFLARVHGTELPPEDPVLNHRLGIERVREYLKGNLKRQVRLEELAAVAGVGKFHLLRLFKKATGLTPYEYLVQARVRSAMFLLRSGHASTFVAHETGFTDQSHLNRHFKRLVGVPPGHFAKACQHRPSRASMHA